MRPNEYPIPAYAAYIWVAGDQLMIGLPPIGESVGHTVPIPLAKCDYDRGLTGEPKATQRGWAILMSMLRERGAAAERQEAAAIGTAASPVRYDIEQMLRHFGHETTPEAAERKRKEAEAAEAVLRDAGIEI